VPLSIGVRHARGVRRLGSSALAITALVAMPLVAVEARTTQTAGADVSAPSWWSGDCDANWWNPQAAAKGWTGPGAHRLGAVYLGVPVCGPRRSGDAAPDVLWRRPGWGELEFECVELAMRFMAQVYGVAAYAANGNGVVRNYSTAYGGSLVKINNGTAGKAPQPGDVISFDNPYLGHVAVVAASSVNSAGDGSITMLSQNDTANGWRTLAVSHWRVAAFGNQTPYGWLHDPAGRGNPTHLATDAGYWMVEASGTVHSFGNAINYGSSSASAVAIASRREGSGYWIANSSGVVRGFGASTVYTGPPALRFGEWVTTISATPSGNGYWLFSNLGRAFASGDAKLYGDMSASHLNGPIVASVATPTGHGYYMVGADGGIFAFGDAVFRGSMGAVRLNRPVVGISPTPDNSGYWLVASDGGVFAFHAPFRGSMGSVALNQPVNGLVAYGNGYLMVASDGGVFDFSDEPFAGSLGSNPPRTPIVGIASTV
jgi:hypothetical protein